MRFRGERRIDFRLSFSSFAPSFATLDRSALISQEFLCDGKVENYCHDVAENAGNEIPYTGYKTKENMFE